MNPEKPRLSLRMSTDKEVLDKATATPQVGDVVEGAVKCINQDGAFVEIDSYKEKCWAQLPTEFSSLMPVSSVEEAGLTVGKVIKATVVEKGTGSVVPGESASVQCILSVLGIKLASAWSELQATFDRFKSFNGFRPPKYDLRRVTVLKMVPAGARVMTQEGLLGLIPKSDYKETRTGYVPVVGARLKVSIAELRPERFEQILQRANTAKCLGQNKKNIVNPQMVRDFHGDYPIVFSYSQWIPSPAIMELASKYKVGDVVDAKIVRIDHQVIMDIEVEGVPFSVRKVEISGTRTGFELTDLFSTEEMIKVYCMESDPEDMRWSIRALEPSPGAILFDKDKVFEKAEETAKIFYERQELEKQEMLQSLFEDFEDPLEYPKDYTGGEWICFFLIQFERFEWPSFVENRPSRIIKRSGEMRGGDQNPTGKLLLGHYWSLAAYSHHGWLFERLWKHMSQGSSNAPSTRNTCKTHRHTQATNHRLQTWSIQVVRL